LNSSRGADPHTSNDGEFRSNSGVQEESFERGQEMMKMDLLKQEQKILLFLIFLNSIPAG
jgi:hypothetical protein